MSEQKDFSIILEKDNYDGLNRYLKMFVFLSRRVNSLETQVDIPILSITELSKLMIDGKTSDGRTKVEAIINFEG